MGDACAAPRGRGAAKDAAVVRVWGGSHCAPAYVGAQWVGRFLFVLGSCFRRSTVKTPPAFAGAQLRPLLHTPEHSPFVIPAHGHVVGLRPAVQVQSGGLDDHMPIQ